MCNGFWLGLVLLTVHLVVCGGLWLLARARTLDVEGYFVPVMLLVPLWGPLCVLLLHTSNRLTGGCSREQMLEKLRINEEMHKNILVADDEGKEAVVPLEEALLVNSPAQKRKLILSVLTDDPAGYYDLLQQARMDNDSEVVHYASTALSQITKEADLKLQKQEQRYASAPDDAAVREEYCDYLESYLDSGFVQGQAAEIQYHQLEQLLKKRIENLGGRRSCTLECRLADVQLSLAEYDRAEKTLEDLTARWPQREAPWVLRLRLAAALRDGAAIQKTLRQIEEKEVYLSAKGREVVRFWQGKQQ
ncbi:MAG: hypothetical protein EGR99_01370 [Faecalibacterium sp.]|nr:hypothetical protein [Faecalibacterium sp.]